MKFTNELNNKVTIQVYFVSGRDSIPLGKKGICIVIRGPGSVAENTITLKEAARLKTILTRALTFAKSAKAAGK